MKPYLNPFAPGAGMPPPELAGRDSLLSEAKHAIKRNTTGNSARSFIYVGLRGVGKTVLLNEVQAMADEEGAITDFIEVSNNDSLSRVMIATMRAALLKLDRMRNVSDKVKQGLRILKSFIGAVKVKHGDLEFSIDIDAELGVADSGTLTRDLAELFVAVGEAAKSRASSIVLLIDEIQNIQEKEYEALIMAVHRVNQRKLPVLVIGAGLPLLVKLSGQAKTYAERLFEYPSVGALGEIEASRALIQPLEVAGVNINSEATDLVIKKTQGYPYFIQEWGYQIWNRSKGPSITKKDVIRCSETAITRLDQNFFNSRYERLSEVQKQYLRAMAELGQGPYRSGDIAKILGKSTSQLGTTREGLIRNGMIFSPEYGKTAFTVPLFDEFMKRKQPDF